ncbi:uncharacterized protein LAESUDRAFT_746824 [Laetiporus sulphureus 93-53]|uniref:Uncharacterized protein n=1 Tax=Laetiporus sulphureus 93-53 TaxID=1314785 RepID=A0A165HS98_9APHY|nr:uncharacterized protein LAESUDRAFT_746824 [Laetiporus sulphureus 93-53]KZT12117.1 hypothetical protein LAESUDRAFT_746824 [Laetiporus sulphureus 93-53]
MQNLNNNNLTLALFLSSGRTPGHLGVLVSTLDDIDTRVHLAPGLAYGPALLLAALVLKVITRLRRVRIQSGRFPRTTVPPVGPVLCRWISLIPARIVHSVRAVLHGLNAAWIVSVCKATLDDIYGPPSKTFITLQLTALLVSGLLLVLLVHAVLRFPAWQCWATSGTSIFTRSTDITLSQSQTKKGKNEEEDEANSVECLSLLDSVHDVQEPTVLRVVEHGGSSDADLSEGSTIVSDLTTLLAEARQDISKVENPFADGGLQLAKIHTCLTSTPENIICFSTPRTIPVINTRDVWSTRAEARLAYSNESLTVVHGDSERTTQDAKVRDARIEELSVTLPNFQGVVLKAEEQRYVQDRKIAELQEERLAHRKTIEHRDQLLKERDDASARHKEDVERYKAHIDRLQLQRENLLHKVFALRLDGAAKEDDFKTKGDELKRALNACSNDLANAHSDLLCAETIKNTIKMGLEAHVRCLQKEVADLKDRAVVMAFAFRKENDGANTEVKKQGTKGNVSQDENEERNELVQGTGVTPKTRRIRELSERLEDHESRLRLSQAALADADRNCRQYKLACRALKLSTKRGDATAEDLAAKLEQKSREVDELKAVNGTLVQQVDFLEANSETQCFGREDERRTLQDRVKELESSLSAACAEHHERETTFRDQVKKLEDEVKSAHEQISKLCAQESQLQAEVELKEQVHRLKRKLAAAKTQQHQQHVEARQQIAQLENKLASAEKERQEQRLAIKLLEYRKEAIIKLKRASDEALDEARAELRMCKESHRMKVDGLENTVAHLKEQVAIFENKLPRASRADKVKTESAAACLTRVGAHNQRTHIIERERAKVDDTVAHGGRGSRAASFTRLTEELRRKMGRATPAAPFKDITNRVAKVRVPGLQGTPFEPPLILKDLETPGWMRHDLDESDMSDLGMHASNVEISEGAILFGPINAPSGLINPRVGKSKTSFAVQSDKSSRPATSKRKEAPLAQLLKMHPKNKSRGPQVAEFPLTECG